MRYKGASTPPLSETEATRLMIKCHLAAMMGERKLNVMDVSRATGIDRGTISRLYNETAERMDLAVLDRLCAYFQCEVGDLLGRTGKR